MSDFSEIQPSDVEVAYILECSQCGDPIQPRSGASSEYEAALNFNKDDWKMTDGEPVCPECQKCPPETEVTP